MVTREAAIAHLLNSGEDNDDVTAYISEMEEVYGSADWDCIFEVLDEVVEDFELYISERCQTRVRTRQDAS